MLAAYLRPALPSSLPVLYLMAPMPLYGSPSMEAAREYPFAALAGYPVKLWVAEDMYRLYPLLAGKRNVTADTALRLSRYFGMSADFWMNLQSAYELDLARQPKGKGRQRIPNRADTAEPRPAA